MRKTKTFYQLASEKLEAMGYKPVRLRADVVGVHRNNKGHTVALKNRTTDYLFRGFPARAAALLIADHNVYPLYPEDFKQATKVEVTTNEQQG